MASQRDSDSGTQHKRQRLLMQLLQHRLCGYIWRTVRQAARAHRCWQQSNAKAHGMQDIRHRQACCVPTHSIV